jgi:hypothetical protein
MIARAKTLAQPVSIQIEIENIRLTVTTICTKTNWQEGHIDKRYDKLSDALHEYET